jgi:hypothetical protein
MQQHVQNEHAHEACAFVVLLYIFKKLKCFEKENIMLHC